MRSTGNKAVFRPAKVRLNIRVAEDLLDLVRRYASRRGTTVTAVIVERFEEIRQEVQDEEHEEHEHEFGKG